MPGTVRADGHGLRPLEEPDLARRGRGGRGREHERGERDE